MGPKSEEVKIALRLFCEAADGWAISEIVGSRKTEPAIFRAAAESL